MSIPKLDDLLIFSKVAQQKNFSRVADQLGIVKSMISKRITRLEADLGVRLINRSTRSMSLTEEGQTLYEYASRIQEEFDGALQAIAVTTDKPNGTLKVAAPLSFGNYALAKITGRFIQEYPDIKVELTLSSQLQDLIHSGVDLAIHVGQPADSNFMARKLAVRKLSVCASPEYFMRMGKPEALDDLVKHDCLIHSRLPEANMWSFIVKNRIKKIKVQGSFVSNSSSALKNAALAGLGIVMLPDYTLRGEVQDGLLQEIFSQHCSEEISIYGLYPYTKHVSPKLRAYLDFLVHELK